MNSFKWILLAVGTANLALSACTPLSTRQVGMAPEAIFTVKAEGEHAVVRVLTHATQCPDIQWIEKNEKIIQKMTLRAAPLTLPARDDAGQKDRKENHFEITTCEAHWRASATQAWVMNQSVPQPQKNIRKIVILADTGCRMKASENAFQPCNDPQQWPFAQIAQSAAAQKPDLVIHIGDMHYRESPCPTGNTGCANSPWGYGYDTWKADFFKPAKPLLAAAPWVFVRGNHESCQRAGMGWFRFLDAQTWQSTRSCNDPQHDNDADYTAPYAVPIAPDAQLLVFDSSKASGKPLATSDVAYANYSTQLRELERLSSQKQQSIFLSHHPLLAYASARQTDQIKVGGNASLQSVFSSIYPLRLFPQSVNLALHGHVHVFEALSFKSDHPTSLVLGNSGSANEGHPPATLPVGIDPYPGAVVDSYASRADYGFATLDRIDKQGVSEWLFTEFNTMGVPLLQCALKAGKSQCVPLPQ